MEKMHQHIFGHNEIVIGGGLDALLYAYFNNCPCIFTSANPPFRFDNFDQTFDFHLWGILSPSKLELWEKLIRVLGLAGLLPMADKTASITIDKNTLKAVTRSSRLGRFEFNKLAIFNDEGIKGLPLINKQTKSPAKIILN